MSDVRREGTKDSSSTSHSLNKSVFFGALVNPGRIPKKTKKKKNDLELPDVSSPSSPRRNVSSPPRAVTPKARNANTPERNEKLAIKESILHLNKVDTTRHKTKTKKRKKKKSTSPPPLSPDEVRLSSSPVSPPSTTEPVPHSEISQYERKLRRVVKTLPQLSVQVLVKHRAMLNQLGQLEVVPVPEYHLVETYKEVVVTPLKLYFLRQAAEYKERPMMPCTNVNYLVDNHDNKHGYEEPIRDRDKNWRELMWTSIAPQLIPYKEQQKEEKFRRALEARKVFQDGVLMNKLLISRQGARFGNHSMVVSVFGMGIAGRVYMKKTKFPRHLHIEAYCPRTQDQYVLRVDLSDLEMLLQDNMELLNPGHKTELCKRILDMVYMENDELCIARNIPAEALQTQIRREKRMKDHITRQMNLDRISKACLRGCVNGESNAEEIEGEKNNQLSKPWLRKQGLIYNCAKKLSGFSVVVTVHSQPRRRSTFVVRAYDPETCKQYELLVSSRELASVLKEKRDPELWDVERRKQHCMTMVHQHLSLLSLSSTEMALSINGRLGIAAPSLLQMSKKTTAKRRGGLLTNASALHSAQSVITLQMLASQASTYQLRNSSAFSRRAVHVFSGKIPRRDIGHGVLVLRKIATISAHRCIASVYQTKRGLDFFIYHIKSSTTSIVRILFEEMGFLLKHYPEEVSRVSQRVPQRNDDTRKLCDIILSERVSIDTRTLVPSLSYEIYRRGHKLRDYRESQSNFTFCIVRVMQTLESLTFLVFDRATGRQLSCELPDDITDELFAELKELGTIEREIHLSVTISTLALDHSSTDQPIVRVIDEDQYN